MSQWDWPAQVGKLFKYTITQIEPKSSNPYSSSFFFNFWYWSNNPGGDRPASVHKKIPSVVDFKHVSANHFVLINILCLLQIQFATPYSP